MELRGIDPRTSHMLSERSTTWATAPMRYCAGDVEMIPYSIINRHNNEQLYTMIAINK